MNSFRARLGLPFAFVWVVGCSLVTPPSSYFDESGEIVTLATVAGTVSALAVTKNDVFYATGAAVYRVSKNGGDVVRLNPESNDTVKSLASNGSDLVVWCTETSGVSYAQGAGGAALLPNSTRCSGVAAGVGQIAFYRGKDPDRGGPNSIWVYDLATKAAKERKASSLGDDARLALLPDGTFFMSTNRGIARPCKSSTEPNCYGDDICLVSTRFNREPDQIFATLSASGAPLVLATNADAARRVQQAECCPKPKTDDEKVADCPTSYPGFAAVPSTVVLAGPFVYQLKEGELLRRPYDSVQDEGEVVRSGLGASLLHLVVDERTAYFVDAQRVQRYAPGCALTQLTAGRCR